MLWLVQTAYGCPAGRGFEGGVGGEWGPAQGGTGCGWRTLLTGALQAVDLRVGVVVSD